jgi:uroporphyrin-III C-methyltransferase
MSGKVYIVGAGPGDPDLLTVKALRLLGAADVVLHDDLVPASILNLVSPRAAVFTVGKRCGQKSVTQDEINALMIAYAQGGLDVVRLHGGDPAVFGRTGEELNALREAEVEFEIVPGVTSPFAAAAAAGISLTERRVSSSVVFLTGHHAKGRSGRKDWPKLAPDSTVVVYMLGSDHAALAQELQAAGLDRETPCMIVSHASSPHQQVHATDLAGLASAPELPAPRILIAGAAVRHVERTVDISRAAEERVAAASCRHAPAESLGLVAR